MNDNGVSESEKNKFFKKCGIDRATRNVISYSLFGIANIGLLAVGGLSGGGIPVGYAVGATVLNGVAHFLKTNKNMDIVLEENKTLKDNVGKLITVRSETSNSRTPDRHDDIIETHVRLPDQE